MSGRKYAFSQKGVLITVTLVAVLVLLLSGLCREISLDCAQRNFAALLEQETGNYNDDRVVLSSTTKREAEAMTEEFGGTLRITDDGSYAVINLPEGMSLTDIAENDDYRKYHDRILLDYNNFAVTEEEIVEEAEVRTSYQVSDPMYPQQTYLDYLNIGDTWNVTRGSNADGEKVTIAIIDTGIDTDHSEFYDADGNSIISTSSYDATNDKVVDQYDISVIEDTDGHGTGVAGVIAAQMNEVGIAGIAPEVELLVIKCDTDEAGEFKSSADIVFAIYYAIEMDVDVINMSLGGVGGADMADALQLAVDSDIICVAAAGNDSTDQPQYPAAYDTVIGVGALADGSWEIADYSNYGPNSDIMAPGTTLTTAVGGEYTYLNGTSMSAPMVSAAAALYVSQNKYTTYEDLRADLQAAGKDLGSLGEDDYYGFGALDVHAFVCEEKGTITYDYCTEDIASTTQAFVRQHTIQTVPEPERDNIIFDDWYFDKAYTRVFDYDDWYATEFVEDITLYAKWVNEDDEDASVYNYRTLSDGTIEIVSYKGKRRYLTIPNEIDGKVVSSIGSGAFAGNTRLREVIFPEGLVYIKSGAFHGVSKMREVTFTGTRMIEIQEKAFQNCTALRKLNLPDSVQTIGLNAFSGCTAMTEVNITENSSLTTLGDFAFSNTAISHFYIPQNVGSDGFNGSVLAYCSNMRGISAHSGNTAFTVGGSTLYNAGKTEVVYYPAALTGSYGVADGVQTIGQYAFAGSAISGIDMNAVETIGKSAFGSTKKLSSVVLPDTVTSMGVEAFAFSSINQVTLPKNLTVISDGVFMSSKLTGVHIPAKVQSVSNEAFMNCSYLQTLTFGDDSALLTISDNAFKNCSVLGNIELPESLETIGEKALYSCRSMTELTIPVNVSTVGSSAFQYCSLLQTVTFADDCALTQIPSYCFANCTTLNTVNFSDGITTLDTYAFGHDRLLSKLNFSSNSKLATVGDSCFYSCSALQTMQLPETVTTIGRFAFAFSGLKQVDLSANVTSIGDGAFGACYVLAQITVDEANTAYATVDNVLFNKDITTVFCVPASRTGSYTLPETVKITAPYSFYYDKFLTAVLLPAGLEDIQQNSFYNCSNMAGIEIPANVTNIGRKAFENCYKLTSVVFASGSKLVRLGIYTFVNCGLSEITIPASVEEIAQYVFYNCNNLKKITFGENSKLSYIAAYLFKGTKVQNVVFEAGSALASIQAHAFDGASYLKSVDFGNAQIANVDNYAFYNCVELESIDIPDTVTYIGRYAFYGCKKLDRIDFSAVLDYIGESAFYGTNSIKVFFAADELPTNVQPDWDKGIAGYFLGAVDYVVTDEWEYSVRSDGTIAVAVYKGSAAELTIDSVDGYTVSKIGTSCFADNDSLTSVTLSENITEIGNYAFYSCDGLTAITVPASVEQIGNYAFADSTAIVTLAAGSDLETIGSHAFSSNATTSLVLPDTVTGIGDGAFLNSSLTTLTIGENCALKAIGQQAFVGSGITSIYLPASLETVGVEAFKDVTSLTSVEIAGGNTQLKLSNSAFEGCGIREITIPSRVYYIGEYTLGSCPNLQNIHVDAANTSYISLDGVLCDIYGTTLIQYPSGRSSAYEVPAQITVLTYASFKNTKGLTEVTFAEGSTVKTIGWQTFSGCDSLAKITVPDTVVSFDFYAFENCTALTDVILGEGTQLSGVYEGAFYGCTALMNITLPDTVVEISDYAFCNCSSLTAIPLTENAQVKGIYDYAFNGCSGITEIPDFTQLVEIGEYAFAYTGIAEYTVPASVKDIASNAFAGCESFTAIYCDEANTEYVAIDGALYEKGVDSAVDYEGLVIWPFGVSLLVGEGKTEISYTDTVFLNHFASVRVEIADSVTKINRAAFAYLSQIEKVIIPDSVKVIDNSAFDSCKAIKSIVLPENITVGSYAFRDCTELQSVIIPGNDSIVRASVFHGCSKLKTAGPIGGAYHIQFGWTDHIPAGVFSGCAELESIEIPDSVTEIGASAFDGCSSLSEIVLPSNLKKLGNKAFSGCAALKSIDIPESVTDMGIGVFLDCSKLKTAGPIGGAYTIRFGWTNSIPTRAFEECNRLESVDIPESVTKIASYAFKGCSSLSEVVLPSNLEKMDYGAFESCTSLKSIMIPESVTDVSGNVFNGCASLSEIVLPENISVGLCAFKNCTELQSVIIPGNDSVMDESVFCGCPKLKSAGPIGGDYHIQFGWTDHIPADAFSGCAQLESIDIPGSVTEIGSGAFDECISLSEVVLPSNLNKLGDDVFSGCTALKSIDIPDSVTEIGSNAFAGCISLSEVVFSGNLSSIDCFAFQNCKALEVINLPETIKSIGYWAFYGCDNLAVVWIHSSELAYLLNTEPEGGYLLANADTILLPDSIEDVGFYITDNYLYIDNIMAGTTSYTVYSNHNHDWEQGETIDYIECQQDGYAYFACKDCHISKEDTIPAHDYEEHIITAATCLENGSANMVCTRCGHQVEVELTAPGSHAVGKWQIIPDSISETGGTYQRECTSCDHIETMVFTNVASGTSGGFTKWLLTDLGELYIYGSGKMNNWSSQISTPWASYRNSITSVTFGPEVTNIGSCAFQNCDNLTEIIVPENVCIIEDLAFSNCTGLKKIELHGKIHTFGVRAFYGCTNLIRATIPDGMPCISSGTFYGCENLVRVIIPESVTTIGGEAFYNCTALNRVSLSNGLIEIGNRAFYNCKSLKEIILPESIEKIHASAFEDCTGLTQMVLPESITEIPQYLFDGCRKLEEVIVSENVTAIGAGAFQDCNSLVDFTIPFGVVSIGSSAFKSAAITSAVIPDGVTDIGDYAFYSCNGLTEVTLPDAVTSIGMRAFGACTNLKAIYVSEGNAYYTSDKDGFLWDKTMTTLIQAPGGYSGSYTIPDSTVSVQSYAFSGCTFLEGVTIQSAQTEIGDSVFLGCTSLTNVSLPEGMTTINVRLFSGCKSLTSVTIPDSVKTILSNAFYDCSGLKEVTLPSNLVSIESSAFSNCSSLLSIEIPEGVTSIANYAFYCCYDLTSITIPQSVTSIGNYAFYSCDDLTSITIPHGVTSIGSYAFYQCKALQEINFNATAMNDLASSGYVFEQAGSSGEGIQVNIGANKERIPARLFYSGSSGKSYVPRVVSVNFENNSACKAIGAYAFAYCHYLSSITFTGDAPVFESANVFNNTTTTAYYPAGNETWTSDVIQNYGGTLTWVSYEPEVHEHSYEAVVTEPTCTEQGFTTYTCSCGDSYVDSYTDALGHSFTNYVSDGNATCTADGTKTAKCDRCDVTDAVTDEGSMLGHEYQDGVCIHCGAEDPDQEIVLSGTCGENVAWTLEDGMLTISGVETAETSAYSVRTVSGAVMDDYASAEETPWYAYRDQILFVVVEGSVSYVGDYAFAGCENLTSVTIQDGVSELGSNIFADSGVETVTFEGDAPSMAEDTFTSAEVTVSYPSGNETWTEEVKQDYGGTVTWEKTIEEPEYTVNYTNASISLAGDIGVNYYAELSDAVLADERAYMEFTVAGETQKIMIQDLTAEENGTYKFTCAVAAKQMTDTIVGQIYLSDGTPVGIAKEYSVKAYCDAAIPVYSQYEANASLVALMEAMLNYGAYSQVQFGYNTDNLANAGMDTTLPELTEDDVAAYAHGAEGSEDGISVASVSLLLESTTTIRFYYNVAEGYEISDYTFFVDGVETAPVESNGQYYVDKTNVAAKELDEMVTVTVGGLTVQYGGLSYVRQVAVQYPDHYSEALVNVAKALYVYNMAANAYFS